MKIAALEKGILNIFIDNQYKDAKQKYDILSQSKKQKLLNLLKTKCLLDIQVIVMKQIKNQKIKQNTNRLFGGGGTCCKFQYENDPEYYQVQPFQDEVIQNELNEDLEQEENKYRNDFENINQGEQSIISCQVKNIDFTNIIQTSKLQQFFPNCDYSPLNQKSIAPIEMIVNEKEQFIFQRKGDKFFINERDISIYKLDFITLLNQICLKFDLKNIQFSLISTNINFMEDILFKFDIYNSIQKNQGKLTMQNITDAFDSFFESQIKFNKEYLLNDHPQKCLKQPFFQAMKDYKDAQIKLQLNSEDFKIKLMSPQKMDSLRIIAQIKNLELSQDIECLECQVNNIEGDATPSISKLKLIDSWISKSNFFLEADELTFKINLKYCNCQQQYLQDSIKISLNFLSMKIKSFKLEIDDLSLLHQRIPIILQSQTYLEQLQTPFFNRKNQSIVQLNQIKQIGQLVYNLRYHESEYLSLLKNVSSSNNVNEVLLNLGDYPFSNSFWKAIFTDYFPILLRTYAPTKFNYLGNVVASQLNNIVEMKLLMGKYISFLKIFATNKFLSKYCMFPNRVIYDLYEDF